MESYGVAMEGWEFNDLVQTVTVEESIDGTMLLKLLATQESGSLPAPEEYQKRKKQQEEVAAEEERPSKKAKKNKASPPRHYTMKDVLKDYMTCKQWNKRVDGEWTRQIEYKRSETVLKDGKQVGRLYSMAGQMLKREFRDTIFHQSSTLDFENCFYRILTCFLKKYFPALPRKNMELFVSNRQTYKQLAADAAGIAPSADCIKELFSGLLMGMGLNTWKSKYRAEFSVEFFQFLKDLSSELLAARTELASECKLIEQDEDTDDYHFAVKNCSYVLQTIESKLMLETKRVLEENGFQVVFLLHDGVEVKGRHEDNDLILQDIQDVLLDNGYNMVLNWKPKTILHLEDVEPVLDDSYAGMKHEFEKKNFKVLNQNCYYTLTDSGGYTTSTCKTFKEKYMHMQFRDEKTEELAGFVDKWMRDRTLRVYKNAGIYPDDASVPDGCFNTFEGFPINKVDTSAVSETDTAHLFLIKSLIRRICENDEHCEFVMKFLAHMFQYPFVKPRMCVIFQSTAQGIGKGTFGDLLISMLGKLYAFKTSKLETMFGQFNGLLFNKILGIIDEVTIPKNEYEQFKGMITEKTITIRNMHATSFVADDYLRYICFLNQNKAMCILEERERRFFITGSNAQKLTGEEITTYLEAVQNPIAQKLFYDELMEMKIDMNYAFDDNRPESTLYNNLKELYRPLEMKFVLDFLLSNCSGESFRRNGSSDDDFYPKLRISHSKMFKLFTEYLSENKYQHVCNSAAFTMNVKSNFNGMPWIKHQRSQRNGRDRMEWLFSDVYAAIEFFVERDYLDKSRLVDLKKMADKNKDDTYVHDVD